MIRQIFAGLMLFWFFVTAGLFVLAALLPAWPSWLELPWSGFEDFVVTPKGEVVIYSAHFQQLLVYDLDGRFVASLAGPRSRGGHRLATDIDGRVYIRMGGVVYVATTLDPDIFKLSFFSNPNPRPKGWVRTEDGSPQAIYDEISVSTPPNRAILAGEVLFWNEIWDRRYEFSLTSGLWVERAHDHLIVHDTDGATTYLGTPWYLYWLKTPLPGNVPLLIAFIYMAFENRLRPWLEGRGNRKLSR